MKTATPASPRYVATLDRLLSEGWCLNWYGHGWRYFIRPRADGLCDTCRVNARTGAVEDGKPQKIDLS